MSAFGNSWLGNSWLGNSWFGNSWGSGGGNGGMFSMNETESLLTDAKALNPNLEQFSPGYWNRDLLAQIGVIQFMDLSWKDEINRQVHCFQPEELKRIFSAAYTAKEIDDLQIFATGRERRNACMEIIQQDKNFQVYWLQLMMMSPGSHPATFLLLKIAARVGEIVMIHYKYHFKRPRPSQVCPALMPVLEVPGHASFPSGHSLLAHLTSNCLSYLAPWAKVTLTRLAERVAKNREYAGLHYASDSEAGREIAAVLHDHLLPQCDIFAETREAASREWLNAPKLDVEPRPDRPPTGRNAVKPMIQPGPVKATVPSSPKSVARGPAKPPVAPIARKRRRA
jgi:membrane-associated phospholipid phosphatase